MTLFERLKTVENLEEVKFEFPNVYQLIEKNLKETELVMDLRFDTVYSITRFFVFEDKNVEPYNAYSFFD